MHDLLSKYLTGDISSEEKLTLFQQLRENPELKICRHLFLWPGKSILLPICNIARLFI